MALTQLRRIPKGDTIEEDHQRDRQLIVRYIMDKTGATYRMVRSYEKMRAGVGMLLAELMRIKGRRSFYVACQALPEDGRPQSAMVCPTKVNSIGASLGMSRPPGACYTCLS